MPDRINQFWVSLGVSIVSKTGLLKGSLDNCGGSSKIHIRHPQGENVPALVFAPLEAGSIPAVRIVVKPGLNAQSDAPSKFQSYLPPGVQILDGEVIHFRLKGALVLETESMSNVEPPCYSCIGSELIFAKLGP